jgi:hypothetical protein
MVPVTAEVLQIKFKIQVFSSPSLHRNQSPSSSNSKDQLCQVSGISWVRARLCMLTTQAWHKVQHHLTISFCTQNVICFLTCNFSIALKIWGGNSKWTCWTNLLQKLSCLTPGKWVKTNSCLKEFKWCLHFMALNTRMMDSCSLVV